MSLFLIRFLIIITCVLSFISELTECYPLYRSSPSVIPYIGAHRVLSLIPELTECHPLYWSSPSVIPCTGAHRVLSLVPELTEVAGICAKYPSAISLSCYTEALLK